MGEYIKNMDCIITAENLSFSYDNAHSGTKKIIDGINIGIERGSFTAIIGHNGSGKSTLAKLLCSVLTPTDGDVTVTDGQGKNFKVSNEADSFDIRKTVGMVFQNPDNQLVATVVEEDVAFAPENLGLVPEEIRERVDDSLKKVGMYEYRTHDSNKLSGGQKQRVAIAGILAMNPECIIFDESTAMLDPKGREDIINIILALKGEGITVILITHYINEAALADRILVLDGGKIVLDGEPCEVFEKDAQLSGYGLEVPQATKLMQTLYDAGYDVKRTVTDGKCAVSEILSKTRR